MRSRLTGAHCGRGSLSGSDKPSRARARQPCALAREVRLVRVAGLERRPGEVLARRGEEAAEAQDALERLGAVARGGVEAAAELALAEPELAGERLDPRPRVGQPRHGRLDRGVRRRAGQLRGEPRQRVRGVVRLELGVQARGELRPQLGEIHAPVAQLAQRQAERRPAGAGPEADAQQHAPGRRVDRHRPGVRARHERAAARAPDQVRAAVGQHVGPLAAVPDDAHPQAGQRARSERLAIPRGQILHSSIPVSGARLQDLTPSEQREPDVVAGDEREERGVEAVERAAVGAEQRARCP